MLEHFQASIDIPNRPSALLEDYLRIWRILLSTQSPEIVKYSRDMNNLFTEYYGSGVEFKEIFEFEDISVMNIARGVVMADEGKFSKVLAFFEGAEINQNDVVLAFSKVDANISHFYYRKLIASGGEIPRAMTEVMIRDVCRVEEHETIIEYYNAAVIKPLCLIANRSIIEAMVFAVGYDGIRQLVLKICERREVEGGIVGELVEIVYEVCGGKGSDMGASAEFIMSFWTPSQLHWIFDRELTIDERIERFDSDTEGLPRIAVGCMRAVIVSGIDRLEAVKMTSMEKLLDLIFESLGKSRPIIQGSARELMRSKDVDGLRRLILGHCKTHEKDIVGDLVRNLQNEIGSEVCDFGAEAEFIIDFWTVSQLNWTFEATLSIEERIIRFDDDTEGLPTVAVGCMRDVIASGRDDRKSVRVKCMEKLLDVLVTDVE
jgi:hypothetical protein